LAIGQGVDKWLPGRSIGIDDAVRLFGSIGGCEPLVPGGAGFRLSGIGCKGAGVGTVGSPKVFGVSVFGGCGDAESCGFCVEDAGGSGVGGTGPGSAGATSAELAAGAGGASVGVDGRITLLETDGLPGDNGPGASGIVYVWLNAPEVGAAGTTYVGVP